MDVQKQDLKSGRGFTLVELLVVIAIIAVLLSVLMPALSKVRKQAESVICKTNLKEVSRLISMYAYDNKGAMVIHTQYYSQGVRPNDPFDHHWAKLLGRYYVGPRGGSFNSANNLGGSFFTIKSFRCPVEYRRWKKDQLLEHSGASYYPTLARGGAGNATLYGYNMFFACPVVADNTGSGKTNTNFAYLWWSKRIKQPTTLPIFWDLDSYDPPTKVRGFANTSFVGYPDWTLFSYGWKGSKFNSAYQNYLAPSANHGKSINYLFLDGHVENPGLWPYDQTVSPMTGKAISLANPGSADDYWTYFHPQRRLYQSGASGAKTIGDAYTGR